MLKSKNVSIRFVEENDAEFILSLRKDEKYNKFLSKVSGDLDSQKEWIRHYKKDEQERKQFYFIIERVDNGTPCGTIRIYDIRDDSFCWGSWILNDNKTRYSALESAFLVYEFGFNNLGYKKSHFDVMKGNDRVVSFHEKMGAEIVGEDNLNFYFEISKKKVELMRLKLMNKIDL